MTEFQTGYEALATDSYYENEDEDDQDPTENIIHVVPDRNKARWNHIEDLDEFFTRVYQYHQRSGFTCMVVQDILQLVQFLFVVLFSIFLIECVEYDVLFYEIPRNTSHKVTLAEAVYPLNQCVARFDWLITLFLVVALLFWLLRLIKVVYLIFKYTEIRAFYIQALKITSTDLANMTWHEVQQRLLEVQKDQQMCIHKQELTQLDIYHRILRFKNYMVAMVNKSLMPLQFRVPFIGEYVFLSNGMKYNLEMILFWGPWSPFENNWHLKPDYKSHHKRKELAQYLQQRILWVGIANLLLSPIIFFWQIFYSFFRYAEEIKREPTFLGARRWSLYARLYIRHFNELDHEFNARLNRGYRHATRYMNIFTSPLLVVVAKHITFFAGSLLAVLVILTVIDEDFLGVQHIIGAMTILGAIVAICRSLIPDEHTVFCPELLMRAVLAQIHYMPDSWKGNAHTYRVRDEFSQFFQYKCVFLLEELLSPFITPFLLCFRVRDKAQDIVDFYRNFTLEVTGVGDVCSFAQMDVRRHGNPQWMTDSQTQANQYQQAEDGKTELSLMHFTLTNPEWKPPGPSNLFINQLKEHAYRDATSMSMYPTDNALVNSLHSMSSGGYGYTSMVSSIVPQSGVGLQPSMMGVGTSQQQQGQTAQGAISPVVSTRSGTIRGGLRNTEGPITGTTNGLLASIQSGGMNLASLGVPPPSLGPQPGTSSQASANITLPVNEETLEMLSKEMSFSALYMHELHYRRRQNPYFDNMDELRAQSLWQTVGSPDSASSLSPVVPPTTTMSQMPNIQEDNEEVQIENEMLPLISDAQSSSQSDRNVNSC